MDTANQLSVAISTAIHGDSSPINFQTKTANMINPSAPMLAPAESRAAALRPRRVPCSCASCLRSFSCFSIRVALAGKIAGKARNKPPILGPNSFATTPARAVVAPPIRNRDIYSGQRVLASAEGLRRILIAGMQATIRMRPRTRRKALSRSLIAPTTYPSVKCD